MNAETFKIAFIQSMKHVRWYQDSISNLEFGGKEGGNPLMYYKQLVTYYSHLEKYKAHQNYLLQNFENLIR